MTYEAPNREAAERAAARLESERKGKPMGGGRTVSRYMVDEYPTPFGEHRNTKGDYRFNWGVVERWTYDGRPELGEFGGAFYWLTPDLYS